MRRHPPEDRESSSSSAGPLFDLTAARERGHDAAQAAADRAESLEPGWRERAVNAVRVHAETHEHFLAEDVVMTFPSGSDKRSSGHIVKAAAREGICVADGYAPARTSNSAPKTNWRSLIYEGERA